MPLSLIAFDADDTLWHNEIHYRTARERFNRILDKYGLPPGFEQQVDETEIQNLPIFGYGATSFALSLIESAIELTHAKVDASDIQQLIAIAKEMIQAEVVLFEGALDTVSQLSGSFPLMLITKGDLQHQLSKLERSGLKAFFQHVEVVSEKSTRIYAEILGRLGIEPAELLMVGNSMRSDILPVLELGGRAVYIRADLSWEHEHAEAVGLPNDRFFQLEDLHQVPQLVHRLASATSQGA